jgi:predicted TIM-barrel fold metal-dependent hydrolase
VIDSLTHVTPDGRWFGTAFDASESTLLRQMDDTGVEHAAVVGLPGHISNEEVLRVCRAHPDRFLPVGSFDPVASGSTEDVRQRARSELADTGLVGVKLHPRISRFDPLDVRVLAFLDELSEWPQPPVVWLCTFLYYPGGALNRGPVEIIHELVGRFPRVPFLLAHGGGPDLLRLGTAVRSCANAYLDFSFTQTKFSGSSVETDLRYLMSTFEKRLVFGSDFPEISIPQALADFGRISDSCGSEAKRLMLGGNLARLLRFASEPEQTG